jgi:hypothetical protein
LAKLEFIIGALGKSADECSKHYELWDVVYDFLKPIFEEISDDDTYDDIITIFSNATRYYIKNEPHSADDMLNSLISIYTGMYYSNLNPPSDIRNLIQKDITNKSFRTKVISMLDTKYQKAYAKSDAKLWFSKNLVEDFNKNESKFELYINETINVDTFYLMSNENLIYFSMVLDKLGTEEQIAISNGEIQTDIYRSNRSGTDLAGLKNKDQMVKTIASMRLPNQIITTEDLAGLNKNEKLETIAMMHNDKKQIITTKDRVLRTFLDSKKIKYSNDATSVETMIKKMNKSDLKELYDRLLDHYYPIINPHENTIVEETKVGHGLKPSEKVIHRKYFIDTHKLNNNVLEVRYNKNRHLTNVKTQVIGHGVKNIIHSIINNDDMNQNEYHVLTEQEKHLIRTILNMLDKSHLLSNADEEFNERFQILLSEYNAGNNSEILRNQIKQYILHAMKLNMIGRQAGQQMIIEMCF